MKKIIIALSVIFLIIIIASLLLTRRDSQTTQENPTPTAQPQQRPQAVLPTFSVQEKQKEVIRINARVLTADQSRRFLAARNKLPLRTDSIDILYSRLLDQYFFSKKLPEFEQEMQVFIQTNGLSDIKNEFPNLFITTSLPVDQAVAQAQDEFINKINIHRSLQEDDEYDQSADLPAGHEIVNGLFKAINSLLKTTELVNGEEDATPSAGTSSQVLAPTLPLQTMIEEVSRNESVPKALLEAMIKKECGQMLSFSSELIQEFSVPESGIDSNHPCYGFISDKGLCCFGPLQFKKTSWQIYAATINNHGDYSHNPRVENIRDSIYASAHKLKLDGGSPDPASWTYDQFSAAISSFNGSCQDYSSTNICESAWQDYVLAKDLDVL